MSWQDELQSLDDQLSAGTIRAEEYRKRRDELLAAASSGAVSLRRVQRQKSPSIAKPSIANAFNGDTKPDTSKTADVTQQVQPVGWNATRPAQHQQQPPMGMQPPSGPPPIIGSEVFSTPPTGPAKKSRVPKFVIAVVVLALVAAGTWWFAFSGGKDDESPLTVPQTTAPSSDLSIDKLPNPTDSPLSTSGVLTVDQLQTYNIIRPDEAAYLSATDLQKVYFRNVIIGTLNYQMFAYQTQTDTGGQRIVSSAVERGKRANMVPASYEGLPAKVTLTKILNDGAAIYEAVYPIERGAVRLVILQTGPNNERQLATTMKRVIETTTASIKPK
ncbi:hypothetical protein LWC34_19525 [Kibdelosporangium philippinense]|uniref:DUF1707 domain-containing protein n=1 Tax=Kibdelosporangium philippinense TaxID=211113 RepID=A0ABS8ZB19_9PSEU|nr:hypothetical protein [Kibdelosporangium philippinense]MCE7005000.1 hypothetical protein [Kibdelosporangium philippinense]